jgi:GNAT superfamily N-acetyltransferase/NTP pyrophosphatase (non-canonical NTP hydrolase)
MMRPMSGGNGSAQPKAHSVHEVRALDLAGVLHEAIATAAFVPRRDDTEPFLLFLLAEGDALAGTRFFALHGPTEEVVGFAVILPHDEEGTVSLGPLYVREPERGKGLGRYLVSTVIRWAGLHGARRLFTQTWGRNATARRLFEHLGFRLIHETPDARIDGDSTVDYMLDWRLDMESDAHTSLGTLRQAVADFVDARDWQPFHTPKNLSMSIAIEAAELMERFQWLTTEEACAAVEDADVRAAVADELADILIYCLSMCNAIDIDISTSVRTKLQANEHHYPVNEFRGRFRRPEREREDES